jgi:HEPN domain-containing protein
MVDIQKQIAYWRDGALKNWELGVRIIQWGETLEGLFFIHLALEKILKAHVCKKTRNLAPRIHTLLRLAELAGLALSKDQLETLAVMTDFCMEGRYPDPLASPPTEGEAAEYLRRSEEVFKWLKNLL